MNSTLVRNHTKNRALFQLLTIGKIGLAVVGIVSTCLMSIGVIAVITGILVYMMMRASFPDATLAPDWLGYVIWIALMLVATATILTSWFNQISLAFRGMLHWARGYGRKSITG